MQQLKQIIGKPSFKIDNDVYTDDRLTAMSIEDLKTLKNRVEEKIQSVATQIKAKNMEYSASGKGASYEWYASQKYIKRLFQKLQPMLNDMIEKRNIEERSVSDYFVDEARNYLDKKTFDTIMTNAVREKQILFGIKKI